MDPNLIYAVDPLTWFMGTGIGRVVLVVGYLIGFFSFLMGLKKSDWKKAGFGLAILVLLSTPALISQMVEVGAGLFGDAIGSVGEITEVVNDDAS